MKHLYWSLTILLVLGLALVACGGGDEPAAEPAAPAPVAESAPAETEAEPEVETAPTATPMPLPEPTAEIVETPDEPAIVALADLQFSSTPKELDSYRYEMIINVTATNEQGEAVNETMTMMMAFVADPPAMSITMTSLGDTDSQFPVDGFTMVQMDGMSYTVFPEFGCMAFPAEDDLFENPMMDEFSPDTILEDLSNVKFVGEETRAGIRVLHYTFDETSLPEDEVEIRYIRGDLYIAKEGGFLVSMIVEFESDEDDFLVESESAVGDVRVRMEFNLRDINEPIEILLPEGCEEQAAGDLDYPILDDATDLFNMFGMISYTTAVSVDEAIEFYQNEMAELGYTYSEGESFIFGSTAMLVFNSSGGSVSINISESEGETSVLIFAGE